MSRDSVPGQSSDAVLRRLWAALKDVEDPEIPVSVVDMGLIVDLGYDGGIARVKLTYTAMGCPAMEMIRDDVRAGLLKDPDVQSVEIQVVWDPVWTHQRLSAEARNAMRDIGIAV